MSAVARIRAVVFDLDGTLLDSFGAIGASLDHARQALGRDPLPPGAVRGLVGFGLDRLLEQVFEAGECAEAKRIYREHYDRSCVAATAPMPGALATLEALKARGFRLAVATNKPTAFARKLLTGLGLAPWLDAIVGAEEGRRLKPHPEILELALQELEVEPEQAIYVGDMHVDIATGHAARVRVVAVATGAEGPAELERAGAELVIGSLPELLDRVGDGPHPGA